jgi:hypothetical protein
MLAQVKTRPDGTVLLSMDEEAARATFASIVFASRYHNEICGLEATAKQALEEVMKARDRRNAICR